MTTASLVPLDPAAPGAPSSADPPALALDGVGLRYSPSEPLVLVDVTLHVAPGEFVCLLGASGCGKSSLLSLIAGLRRPSSGHVRVPGGRPALMFQESALFPWLTVGQNVELPLRLAGMGRSERRARSEELLSRVQLDGHHRRRVHELSGGMRQRAALARALAQRPRVLLMDEPFSSLDAISRDALHDELDQVWARTGMAVVFVTHDVREAVRLGQRVELMSSRPGRIVRRWQIEITGPRGIESPDVAVLAREITAGLREEIRRHGTGPRRIG